jgi:Alcohol dehydrogenase transcription factor Myb/SANT-like.
MVRFVQTLGQSTPVPQFVAVYLSNMANKTTEDEKREFIGVYRGLPDAWKVKSDGYKDRIKKDTAYKMLVEKIKEIDAHADRASVRAKINVFRSAYRREFKKVKECMKSGGGTDEVCGTSTSLTY